MEKLQSARRHSGEGFQHGPGEQFEGHHGGDGIARQTEKIAPLYASEDDWPARLNLCSREEELGAQFGEHLLHQVVLAHGNAAGEQQKIMLQTLLNQAAQSLDLIGSNIQHPGHAARLAHLSGKGIAVGVADLMRSRLLAQGNNFVAGGKDRNLRPAKNRERLEAHDGVGALLRRGGKDRPEGNVIGGGFVGGFHLLEVMRGDADPFLIADDGASLFDGEIVLSDMHASRTN